MQVDYNRKHTKVVMYFVATPKVVKLSPDGIARPHVGGGGGGKGVRGKGIQEERGGQRTRGWKREGRKRNPKGGGK